MKKEYEIKCEPVTPGDYIPAIWQEEILDENLNIIQERKIIQESKFVATGNPKIKYNVYYYENGQPATLVPYKEFHSEDGVNGEIRQGYVLKTE